MIGAAAAAAAWAAASIETLPPPPPPPLIGWLGASEGYFLIFGCGLLCGCSMVVSDDLQRIAHLFGSGSVVAVVVVGAD